MFISFEIFFFLTGESCRRAEQVIIAAWFHLCFPWKKFWVLEVTVYFHSTMKSFISRDQGDSSWYDPFKVVSSFQKLCNLANKDSSFVGCTVYSLWQYEWISQNLTWALKRPLSGPASLFNGIWIVTSLCSSEGIWHSKNMREIPNRNQSFTGRIKDRSTWMMESRCLFL